LIFGIGCSDVFRPVAIPIVTPGGDPQITQRAMVLNNNGGGTGTAMLIDTAADAILGVFTVGRDPAYAGTVANETFVANRGSDSVSVINNFAVGGTSPDTVVLPVGTHPQFVLAQDPATVYTANANGTISAISVAQEIVT